MVPRRAKNTGEIAAFSTADERWQAVLNRDPAAEGHFFYAVITTGIYCRPTCPSRRPLLKHVQFYRHQKEAEEASFRACKRCCPQGEDTTQKEAHLIADVCRQLEAGNDSPSLAELAASVGLSPSHLHRRFKQSMGITPKKYAVALRSNRVREELSKGESVSSAIYGAGFNSNARFYAASSQMLGMTPSEYRRGGKGREVHYATGICSLGNVLVAASERGVCAILLGDEPGELLRDLQSRFAQATILPGEGDFNTWVSRVIGFIDAPSARLDLPLDVRGTLFQRRVWQELIAIPPGKTASYSEIARRLGDPKSTRAVAGACAANALAVAIPCHRVVRTDGSLSGYRWGTERKQALLEREAALERKRRK